MTTSDVDKYSTIQYNTIVDAPLVTSESEARDDDDWVGVPYHRRINGISSSFLERPSWRRDVAERTGAPESSRVVAASASDICDVAIERQIFVKRNAEQLAVELIATLIPATSIPADVSIYFRCGRFPNRTASVLPRLSSIPLSRKYR